MKTTGQHDLIAQERTVVGYLFEAYFKSNAGPQERLIPSKKLLYTLLFLQLPHSLLGSSLRRSGFRLHKADP